MSVSQEEKSLQKNGTFPLTEEKTTSELIEHIPNIVSPPEFEVLTFLLEGRTWTARQIYRKMALGAVKKIYTYDRYGRGAQLTPEEFRLYVPPETLTDREIEHYLSNARKRKKIVNVIAYNTIQRLLERLREKNIVELVRQNGSKEYGLSYFFFSAWKKARNELHEKIRKTMEKEKISKEEAMKSLGLRKIDIRFFRLF